MRSSAGSISGNISSLHQVGWSLGQSQIWTNSRVKLVSNYDTIDIRVPAQCRLHVLFLTPPQIRPMYNVTDGNVKMRITNSDIFVWAVWANILWFAAQKIFRQSTPWKHLPLDITSLKWFWFYTEFARRNLYAIHVARSTQEIFCSCFEVSEYVRIAPIL